MSFSRLWRGAVSYTHLERYETLMTAPRRDLGDSIRKAFSNVDDILTDMSLDKTLENQRAHHMCETWSQHTW